MRKAWRHLAVAGTVTLALMTVSAAVSTGASAGRPDLPVRHGTVQTTGGWIRGVTNNHLVEYLGIPYAAPPVGALRWQAPQPATPWSGVRDATRFGNRCVQGTGWDPGYDTPKLNEDCLYLNVYVPADVRPNAPVLVWIHGGGFTGGAGQDTDPRRYVEATGSVYVTINYRLGAVGYLDLPALRTGGATGAGNYGLLDQQAALRWVHRDIRAFGGDPGNVTIAGQSAGGSSVCDQLASPTARGLFRQAVIVSGGCGMSSQAGADTAGAAFATAAGCPDPATAVACLRGRTPAEILAAQATAPVRPAVGGPAFPVDPAVAVTDGDINRVPVINGQVHDESRLFVFGAYDFTGHPVTAAQYEATVRATYGAAILAAYPVGAYVSPSIALATVQSDAGSYTRLKLDRSLARWVPTYAYEFAEESTPQFYSIYRLQQAGGAAATFPFGATHVDDLGYLWEYLGHTLPYSDDELALSDQMTTFWDRFQNTGNPNAVTGPDWPRFTATGGSWMELTACVTAESGNQPPAACSAAGTGYLTDHKLALWASVLG